MVPYLPQPGLWKDIVILTLSGKEEFRAGLTKMSLTCVVLFFFILFSSLIPYQVSNWLATVFFMHYISGGFLFLYKFFYPFPAGSERFISLSALRQLL